MRVTRSILLRACLAGAAAALMATGCGSLAEKEREWTFRVVKGDAGWYSGTPAAVQDVFIPVKAPSGTQKIHAWWWPDADPEAPVVYYLHGVRWNLTGHLRRMEQLRAFGFSVFAIDYRGFGKSDGDLPSEDMTYEDAAAGLARGSSGSCPTRRSASCTGIRSAGGGDRPREQAREAAGSCDPRADRGILVSPRFPTLRRSSPGAGCRRGSSCRSATIPSRRSAR